MTNEHRRQSLARAGAWFYGIAAVMVTRSNGSARCCPSQVIVIALVGLMWAQGMSTTALAQGVPDSRVALHFRGGYQTNVSSFSQTVMFEQYSETGSLTSSYTVRRGPVLDAGLTVRVWRTFGVGVSGSYFHDSGLAQVNALVPHPFVFGQPRQVNGSSSVPRTEIGMHFQAAYWAQPSQRLEVVVTGGPSVFRVDQDFVSDVTFTQTAPYDTATYQGSSVIRQRKTVSGGNIGGEIGWRVARRLGLAAAVGFSRARAQFPGTSAQAVVIGGLHVGGGVRLLF
jgi:hypothetical protein